MSDGWSFLCPLCSVVGKQDAELPDAMDSRAASSVIDNPKAASH